MNEQSNTQFGPFQILAGESLVGKEGYLVKIANDSGTAKAYLPDAVTDLALFVVLEGAAAAAYVTLQPLAHAQQARAELESTVAIGARLRLYTPDGTNDGKVATIGASAGVYFSPGIALETGADGQLVLFQPDPQMVIVPGATIADPAGCAAMTATLTGVDTGTDMTAAQAATIVADLGALKAAADANNAAIDSILAALEAAGIVASA